MPLARVTQPVQGAALASTESFRTVSRQHSLVFRDGRTSPVRVGAAEFGGPAPVVVAGPCAVEGAEQTLRVARAVRECGAHVLRGGAFKPRTSPYDFQGLGEEGLKILAAARAATGLPVVTEVLDVRQVDLVAQYADMLQVGSRSMQNFPLLTEVGRSGKPVLLKRAMAASLYEWLCAAEYVAKEGNTQIVLCERGIRSFNDGEYARFALDLNVVSAARRSTFLPIIVDPSHAAGRADTVVAAARAAMACGAHGLIIEVIAQDTPRDTVRCDGLQAIRPRALAELIRSLDTTVPPPAFSAGEP
jgi:3-deoxy-7-phosphoheptulonate synthase